MLGFGITSDHRIPRPIAVECGPNVGARSLAVEQPEMSDPGRRTGEGGSEAPQHRITTGAGMQLVGNEIEIEKLVEGG